MPTDFAFRLSTYLTLGLSCLCLGYAEWEHLPEASILAGLVIVALVISFRAEGRFELSLKAANRVGLVIALAGGAWLAYQFYSQTSLIYTYPWPASLLPYLGPLLMVLMPAKLFRPKHVGDWWAMQGIGLAAVGLASAMAENEVFGFLLAMYSIAGVCSLTLFYFRRSAGTLLPVPNTEPDPPTTILTAASGPGSTPAPGRAILWRSLGWVAISAAFALPLFFITPRTQNPHWQFGKTREVGFGADQVVDLNRTGDLRINREVAWEVKVTHTDGRPKEDLNLNQRWRGIGYHTYEKGMWRRNLFGRFMMYTTLSPIPKSSHSLQSALPDQGPDAVYLHFTPRGRRLEPVVADPTTWSVGSHSSIVSETDSGPRLWHQITDASFRPPPTGPGRLSSHLQVIRPFSGRAGDEDLSPPFEMALDFQFARSANTSLIAQYSEMTLPRVRTFAQELLTSLANSNPALAQARDRVETRRSFELAPEDFEPVARAFSAHLANSGEYTYSLITRRTDRNTDPIEDFLLRNKAGHCERYAAALALLCRAVGIPAIYVLGFKGCEPDGNGVYLIRQDHAHAWVEVLVPRPTPADYPFAPGRKDPRPAQVWHWLSLDPAPSASEEPAEGTLQDWFGTARETWAAFFLDFIVGYNSDRRQHAVESAELWLTRWGWSLLLLPLVGAIGLGARSAFRRWQSNGEQDAGSGQTGYVWFDQLRDLLADHDFPPKSGATPRELAKASAERLHTDPRTRMVAQIPIEVTKAFYRARYGNRPPTAEEEAKLIAAVERLGTALNSIRSRAENAG